MVKCQVETCGNVAAVYISGDADGEPWNVCELHAQELKSRLVALDAAGTLFVGDSAPPEVVYFEVRTGEATASVVTLGLGWNGIESKRLEFLMEPALAERLCAIVGKSSGRE